MKLKVACAALLTAIALSPAMAQSPNPQPKMPTQAQCDQGYVEGMGWTRDQFVKACAEMKDKKP